MAGTRSASRLRCCRERGSAATHRSSRSPTWATAGIRSSRDTRSRPRAARSPRAWPTAAGACSSAQRDRKEAMNIWANLRDFAEKAKGPAAEHKDQIRTAVEKAEAAADQQTGGRYHEQIVQAGKKVQAYVENLDPAQA